MNWRILRSAILLLGLCFLLPAHSAPILSTEEMAAVDAINAERAARGFGTFSLNDSLIEAAERHSTDMATEAFFGHTGSDGSSPSTRVADAGFTEPQSAELLANSFSSSGESVAQQWIDSPPHSEQLFSSSFSQFGIALDSSGTGLLSNLWTLLLGGPSTSTIPPADGPGDEEPSMDGDPDGGDPTGGVPIDGGTGSVREVLTNLFNGFRDLLGLSTLETSPELEQAAQSHAEDMAINLGHLRHTGSDGSQFFERSAEAGFAGTVRSELLATTRSPDPNTVFELWRNSDLHRDVMLLDDLDLMGIGIEETTEDTWWSITLGTAPPEARNTVPVPSTLLLLVLGASMIGLARRLAFPCRLCS